MWSRRGSSPDGATGVNALPNVRLPAYLIYANSIARKLVSYAPSAKIGHAHRIRSAVPVRTSPRSTIAHKKLPPQQTQQQSQLPKVRSPSDRTRLDCLYSCGISASARTTTARGTSGQSVYQLARRSASVTACLYSVDSEYRTATAMQ